MKYILLKPIAGIGEKGDEIELNTRYKVSMVFTSKKEVFCISSIEFQLLLDLGYIKEVEEKEEGRIKDNSDESNKISPEMQEAIDKKRKEDNKHLCKNPPEHKPWIGTEVFVKGKIEAIDDGKELPVRVRFGDYSTWIPESLIFPFESTPQSKKEQWEPEDGQIYYYVVDGIIVDYSYWSNRYEDSERFSVGNVFKTKEQAEVARGKIKELLLGLKK